MFDDVVDALREKIPPELWSPGLQLAASGAVRVESITFHRWTFNVGHPPNPIHSVQWSLGVWLCSCGAFFFSCSHLVAAAVTLKAIGDSLAAPPPPTRAPPRLTYRLRSEGRSLHLSVLQRYTTEDGRTHQHTLVGEPSSADVIVAALPPGRTEAWVYPEIGPELAPYLAVAAELELDGAPTQVAPAPLEVPWLAYERSDGRHPLLLPYGLKFRANFSRSACVLLDDGLHFLRPSTNPLFTFNDSSVLRCMELLRPLWPNIPTLIREFLQELEAPVPLPVPGSPSALPPATPPAPPPRAPAVTPDRPAPPKPTPATPPPPAPPRVSPTAPPQPAPAATPESRGQPAGEPPTAPRPPSPEATPARPAATATTPTPPSPPEPRAPTPSKPTPTLSPHWKASGSDYDVTFRATGDGGETFELPSAQVLPVWRRGAPTIEVKRGLLAALPVDWLARYGPILERLHAARDQAGKIQRWARPVAASLCLALNAVPPPELAGLAALLDDFSGVPSAHLPSGLKIKLRDYQRRGVDWLCLLRDAELGALLADDMGLGKTVQTICILRHRTLIVAPTSTLPNWVAEIRKFRPRLKVSLYHGQNRRLDPKAEVIVTSYTLLRNDKDKLCKHEWDIVVLDEAQAIKEARTVTAGAAFALKARWRLALSGTPVENRLTELWSICHFLNPGLLGAGKDFISAFSRPIESGSAAELAELQAKIRPFVLRRRKSEVARELPPRTDIVLTCQLDEHEREVYDALRAASHDDVTKHLKAGGDVLAALELLLRLRQAACHVGLVPGQTATRSSKLDLLLEHLVDVTGNGHRALVFSQWTSLLDKLEPALAAHRLDFVRLDGKTQDRETVVARFQAANGPPVMLLSLKAGGVGLNLTAADHVYLLDPWWNPAAEDQAADRTHRIGQDRPVFVHRLVAEDTVEERILELHRSKRELAVTAVDGSQTPNLTREDLLELLR